MPELPEVETIRRQLEPAVSGRRIESVEVFDERWTRPTPSRHVVEALEGRTIQRVERRGKYLILRLDGHRALVMHLRMTGSVLLQPPRAEAAAELGGPRVYEAP